MKHEDIIRIARENGIDWFRIPGVDQVLVEKFAEAIADAVREDIAQWFGDIQVRLDGEWVSYADAVRARGKK